MTRITKMDRPRHLKSTEFVSKDLKEKVSSGPEPGDKKKRSRHRQAATKEDTNEQALSKSERDALKRRSRREKQRERNMECFLCRQKGHSISNCPRNSSQTDGMIQEGTIGSICYRCGSLEHTLNKCPQKKDSSIFLIYLENSLPFSTCFVCKQQGHLAGQCPQNEKGVYPNGGSCKFCGSVRHLSFQCKPLQNQEGGTIMLGTLSMNQGGDDDDIHVSLDLIKQEKSIPKPKTSQPKVIRF